MKPVRVLSFVAASLFLGAFLARFVDTLPIECPALISGAQWTLRTLAPGDVHNPDSVAFAAGAILYALAVAVSAVALRWMIRLFSSKPKHHSSDS